MSIYAISVPLYTILLLLMSIDYVTPGANDLHFYDGASTADVVAGDVFFEIMDPPELRYSFRIRPAKDFGATFNETIKFERARLVPTVPLHSCTDILNEDEIVGHIALAERGECSFVFKTVKAQEAGAKAIIITESTDKWDDSLDHLIEMVDDNEPPYTPSLTPKISHCADVDELHVSAIKIYGDYTNRSELDIHIPAGFLLGRSGNTILRTLRKLNKKYAIINLPINMTHVPINKMNQPPWIAW